MFDDVAGVNVAVVLSVNVYVVDVVNVVNAVDAVDVGNMVDVVDLIDVGLGDGLGD